MCIFCRETQREVAEKQITAPPVNSEQQNKFNNAVKDKDESISNEVEVAKLLSLEKKISADRKNEFSTGKL